ncbi:hypothetical protein ACP70R_037108 [Stipagrostis hirtigluma subsp. patula]
MAMKQPLLPITQSSKPSLARRAKERLLHVGQQNLDFAYKRLPAHDKRAKRTLDCLAIVLGFAVSCIFFLALLLYCRALYVGTYWVMEGALGHYQVEVLSGGGHRRRAMGIPEHDAGAVVAALRPHRSRREPLLEYNGMPAELAR